jgi:hypothetical protein
VHRAARICAVAHGRQIVVSGPTRACVHAHAELRDLGLHRLKDLAEPVRLYQLGDAEFPPLRSLNATNLPVQPNALVGRERELEEVTALLRDGARLVPSPDPAAPARPASPSRPPPSSSTSSRSPPSATGPVFGADDAIEDALSLD